MMERGSRWSVWGRGLHPQLFNPPRPPILTVTLTDTLTRRSISQQRLGVSITIDDPVRTAQFPSPPRAKPSHIVHICNLVRRGEARPRGGISGCGGRGHFTVAWSRT